MGLGMIKDNPYGIKVYYEANISLINYLKNSINKSTYFNNTYYTRWINSNRYGFRLKYTKKGY
jgi:hypothetical protein